MLGWYAIEDHMTLSDFIEADLDGLIDEWTQYAVAVGPKNSHLNQAQLRDSARELLIGIAADMRRMQTDAQQEAKSHGDRLDPDSAFNQVGRGHADERRVQVFKSMRWWRNTVRCERVSCADGNISVSSTRQPSRR